MNILRLLMPGVRIVVVPKLPTAPSWAYVEPKGSIVSIKHGRVIVRLDDGAVRETYEENIVLERLYKAPEDRGFRPAFRPHKPLREGPWEELTFDDAS